MQGLVFNISDSPEGYKRNVEVVNWGCDYSSEKIFANTVCRHYENVGGEIGELVQKQRIVNFSRELAATMFRFVDPVDGMDAYREQFTTTEMEPIPVEEQVEGGPTEREVIIYHEQFKRVDNDAVVANPFRQFIFFNALVNSGAINIPQLIGQFVMAEDLIHKSYDK